MSKYALTNGIDILEIRVFDDAAKRLTKAEALAKGKPWWLPYIVAPRPAYDFATHHAPVRDDDVILEDRVEQVWLPAVAKTQAEIDAEKENKLDDAISRLDTDMLTKGLALTLFDIASGTLSIPNGGLTLEQFKTYIRNRADS